MGQSQKTTRRRFLATGAAGIGAMTIARSSSSQSAEIMYGLISEMNAAPGQRDTLISILLEGSADMPGCLSYVIAKDSEDPDAIWITEVWDREASHRASLSLPSVQDAIARGRPMIAGVSQRVLTEPVGGHGLD